MRKLGILLKTNLLTTFNINKFKKEKPIKLVLYLLFATYLIFSLSITFGAYAAFTAAALEKYNLISYMIIIFFILASFVTFVFTINDAKNNMFNANDNSLLLSMPIKTNIILASRLLKTIIWNLFISLFVIIPMLYVYATRVNITFSFYPKAIIIFLLLPIIPTIIASLIGYFIAYIASKVNFKNWIELFLSVFFIIIIYYLLGNGNKLLEMFITNQESLIKIIKWLFYPIYLTYEAFNNNNNNLSLILYIFINIVIFSIFVILLSRSFRKIIIKLQENKAKSNYVLKTLKTSSQRKALLKKEIKRYFSSPVYVLNTFFGIATMLIGAVASIFYDKNIILSVLDVNAQGTSLFELLIMFIIFVSFLSNTASASISLEGKNFWIVKSLPITPISILNIKLLFNILVIVPFSIISIIIFKFTLDLTSLQTLTLIIISLISSLVLSHFGLLMNLKFPKMDAVNDVAIVKRSASVMISIIIPIIIITSISGIYIDLEKSISMFELIRIFIILMVVILIIERLLLIKWGIKKLKIIN